MATVFTESQYVGYDNVPARNLMAGDEIVSIVCGEPLRGIVECAINNGDRMTVDVTNRQGRRECVNLSLDYRVTILVSERVA